MQNLLFICSRNQWRSPTVEKIYSRDARVNAKDIEWASTIFVMDYKHKDRLKADYARLLQYKKVIVLDIPDEYTIWMRSWWRF